MVLFILFYHISVAFIANVSSQENNEDSIVR